jgi:hypothetical protein
MFDLNKLPKISLSDDNFQKIVFGLLPIILGILVLLVLMLLSEI